MSFDPFHQQPPHDPPPVPPAPAPAYPGAQPLPPAGGAPAPAPADVRQRVLFPAVLLLVAGVLNLLFAGYLMVSQAILWATDEEVLRRRAAEMKEVWLPALEKSFPDIRKAVQQREAETGEPIEDEIARSQKRGGVYPVLSLLCSALTVLAGVRMLQLRNYRLVMLSSVLASIPCLTLSGCCCIGQVAGLSAVFMLLQREVYEAFR